jgi:hypothetical protein
VDKFTIHSFKKLKDTALIDVVDRLRAIPGKFQQLEDPLKKLREIRRGDDAAG